MEINVRWDSNECSDGNKPEGTATIYSTPVVKGKWLDWVFKVRWDYRPGGQGYVEIWHDKIKRPTYNGPNCYNDKKEMYLKTGVYRWVWNHGSTNRVLYIDEVKMGNENCSYEEISAIK